MTSAPVGPKSHDFGYELRRARIVVWPFWAGSPANTRRAAYAIQLHSADVSQGQRRRL